MLHPEFFTSLSLARLEYRAMLTFAGLWIYCDDYGRGEDDPSFVAATVWPRRPDVTAADAATDLEALAEVGVVCRYGIGGVPLLHVPSWHEHQKVSHPTPSKLPPCPTCDKAVFSAWYRDDDPATDKYRKAEKGLRAAKTAVAGDPEPLANSSGETREYRRRSSGATPTQFSLVKSSSVKGTPAESLASPGARS
jgi:hypothetical protein